jgi:two-component system, chemotaxis family, protein-glutamate methylesterase/glutaminase
MTEPIRVLVVDDSAMARHMLISMLARDPAIRVVGEARDGHECIRMVEKLRPDVVTMDVLMPGLDGLATTEHLMAYLPTPILVLTASLMSNEVDITFKMLDAGALEVLEKPAMSNVAAIERATRDLIRRIKVLSRVRVVTHLRGRRRAADPQGARSHPQARPIPASPAPPVALNQVTNFPLIVIGASTGGPRVVQRILADLPSDLPAAVVVVQHIAEGFSGGMAEWLQHTSTLPVRVAREDELLRVGEVLIAPDQRDLLITPGGTIHLTHAPLLIQRPSIDIAMQAVAEVFAHRAIGVLLTGMGRDGAFGMLTIRRRGGHTIAQDEQSSTIFGMPKVAIQLGAAMEVLNPGQIAPRIAELANQIAGQLAQPLRRGGQ